MQSAPHGGPKERRPQAGLRDGGRPSGALRGEFAARAAALIALWWVLTEGRADNWPLGAAAAAAAAWLGLALRPAGRAHLRLAALPAFAAFFVWHSLLGGWQAALLAFRGRDALRPDVVELRLALAPGAPRVLMVSVLGLMPGTLGVRLDGDRLHLHVLDRRQPTAAMAVALEARIARLYEERA